MNTQVLLLLSGLEINVIIGDMGTGIDLCKGKGGTKKCHLLLHPPPPRNKIYIFEYGEN